MVGISTDLTSLAMDHLTYNYPDTMDNLRNEAPHCEGPVEKTAECLQDMVARYKSWRGLGKMSSGITLGLL